MHATPVTLDVAVHAPGFDLLALHARDPARYPVLLETAATAEATPGSDPQFDWLLFRAPGSAGEPLVVRVPPSDGEGLRPATGFLRALDAAVASAARLHGPLAMGELPFCGGFFAYCAYELAAEVEPVLRLPQLAGDLVATLLPIAGAVVRHRLDGRLQVVALPAYRELAVAVHAEVEALAYAPSRPLVATDTTPPGTRNVSEDPDGRFLAQVAATLEAIAAGEVYQANLSRAWHTALLPGETPAALYARLRAANPGPYAGIAALPGLAVLSTSPERLVRVRGTRIDTRPIAGTRPRVEADAVADAQSAAALRAHPKEQAEHVMLVDLERNDLGRLCAAGTVQVDEFMVLERYAHVHHIVSNVSGTLRRGTTPGQVLRALFPGGTITGCPKVRCMQLIADLEQAPRGAYTGAMGWIAPNGDLDLNILIRTATVGQDGAVTVRAGAGIVADSDPTRELAETRAKARGLLRGLGVAPEAQP